MRKLTFIIIILLSFLQILALPQKEITIPKKIQEEFVKSVQHNFDFHKDYQFFIYQTFHNTGTPEVAVKIENLKMNKNDMDKILLALYQQVSYDRNWMFKNLYKWGLTTSTAKYLTDYTINKFPQE